MIPKKYRNHLYGWKSGGYDGCLWERNFGYVDRNGDWTPIYSTGCDGLDCHDLRDRKLEDLQTKYKTKTTGAEVQGLENDLFMGVVNGDIKRNNWTDYGLLDSEHIVDVCKKFCEDHSGDVSMIVKCLDALRRAEYDPVCICTECGNTFADFDYDSYEAYIDREAYHGNGGVGVYMTRILCPNCVERVECPTCHGFRLPNDPVGETVESLGYDSFAKLIYEWAGICDSCADKLLWDLPDSIREETRSIAVELGDGRDGGRSRELLRRFVGLVEAPLAEFLEHEGMELGERPWGLDDDD